MFSNLLLKRDVSLGQGLEGLNGDLKGDMLVTNLRGEYIDSVE
jgi:hypothetical protein